MTNFINEYKAEANSLVFGFDRPRMSDRRKLFLENLEYALDNMLFREIPALINLEHEFLVGHYDNLSSLRSSLQEYKLEAGELDYLLKHKFRLSSEEYKELKDESRSAALLRRMYPIIVYDYKTVINRALHSLKNSHDFGELFAALAVLTGRRKHELMMTAEFEFCHPCYLHFSGDEKSGLKRYSIPVLVDAQVIVDGYDKLLKTEEMLEFRSKSKEEQKASVDNKYYRDIYEPSIKKLFDEVINRDFGNKVKYTRAFYAMSTAKKFKAERTAERVHIRNVLGHTSYEGSLYYQKVRIVG